MFTLSHAHEFRTSRIMNPTKPREALERFDAIQCAKLAAETTSARMQCRDQSELIQHIGFSAYSMLYALFTLDCRGTDSMSMKAPAGCANDSHRCSCLAYIIHTLHRTLNSKGDGKSPLEKHTYNHAMQSCAHL